MKKIINLKTILSLIFALFVLWFFFLYKSNPVATVAPRASVAEAGVKIIAFGDSLTAGYGLPASESYPALLEAELKRRGAKVTVINSGVSGETTRGNLERAEFIRKQNPDLVLLGIGGNDALRLLPVEETKKNIAATIAELQSGINPPVVVLLRMQAPLNAGLGYKQTFDGMYDEIAESYAVTVLPFITAEVFLNNEYKLNDGIHFNRAGYEQIINLYLVDVVADIVAEMDPAK
jgi:acyl-CoA thioesterase I